jgi:hypothetical protein
LRENNRVGTRSFGRLALWSVILLGVAGCQESERVDVSLPVGTCVAITMRVGFNGEEIRTDVVPCSPPYVHTHVVVGHAAGCQYPDRKATLMDACLHSVLPPPTPYLGGVTAP